MISTLSLNDCAARLAATVRSPRFDLFLDLRPGATRATSPGRMGSCYFTTGGHCHGHSLPETAVMMIGFAHRSQTATNLMTVYSAS